MASLQELRNIRLEKITTLEQAGMRAYAQEGFQTYTNKKIIDTFNTLEKEGESIVVAGRVMAIRGQGAINFVPLYDGTETLQIVLKEDETEPKLFELFQKTVDRGDFIQATGTLFVTERGAQSLLVQEWKMLTKSLLPLPDKRKGLQDIEERYRKRYLDILMNPEVRDRFSLRARVMQAIRSYFDDRGFMEVETPVLQNQAGGAMARTFNTYHNDYDMPMVLRIAVELDHKLLMAAGYPRIYGIDKDFRNEGTDPTHLQEFTMMEWYAAYATLQDNMQWTENLLRHLARDVVGETIFTVYDKKGNGVEVDFEKPWKRIRFDDLLRENADLDMQTATLINIQDKARQYGMSDEDIATTGRANTLDFIYKKSSRLNIIDPTFVTNYPSDLKPLAQQNADGTAEVAQLIIGGAEITNMYAELVDPIVQRQLLEGQSAAKAGGDDEAMDVDERFLTAMEHGMPPMTGFGMGIDRLMAIFTNQKNVRDVVFFPIMRPRSVEKNKNKKKEALVATVVINRGAGLEPWQEMNTVAHLNAAYGARKGKELFAFEKIQSKEGTDIMMNTAHAIMIRTAQSVTEMKKLVVSARESGLHVEEFTREMLETSNDKKVKMTTAEKEDQEIEHLGILLFGPRSQVNALTEEFSLFA